MVFFELSLIIVFLFWGESYIILGIVRECFFKLDIKRLKELYLLKKGRRVGLYVRGGFFMEGDKIEYKENSRVLRIDRLEFKF